MQNDSRFIVDLELIEFSRQTIDWVVTYIMNQIASCQILSL